MLLCYTPGDVVAEQFLNLNLTNNLTGNNSDMELQFSIFHYSVTTIITQETYAMLMMIHGLLSKLILKIFIKLLN